MMSDLRSPSRWLRIALFTWLVAVVALALVWPLLVWRGGEGPGKFSVTNARESLRWIAREPHPVGTRAHAEVGRRLAQELRHLGLQVETQDGSWLDTRGRNNFIVRVHNVLARLPGTGSTGSVLLMAHYDSATHAPGAADDGVGVAVLLETARILRSEARLRNDVILVATDGEEPGLFGARVFLASHPWATGIGALLNFEARGLSGPSVMFETGERDGWLVSQFASAAPAPFANSLAPSIYARMGNATDLTIFRGTGVPRLNFGFVESWQSYHTPWDTPDRVDADSVWHHGSSALALARRLGQIDLRRAAEDRSRLVYFNLGPAVVRYDERAAIPFAGLAAIVCGWVTMSAWRAARLRLRDAIGGIVAVLPLVIIITLTARVAWRAVVAFDVNQRALFGRPVIYIAAFVVLTIGAMLLVHRAWRRIAPTDGLVIGVMFWFAIAGVCAAVWMPGASYIFAWPLVGAAVAAWGCRRASGAGDLLAIAAGSLIILCILVPTIWMVYVAVPWQPFAFVPLIALTFMLLMPCVELIAARASWPWLAGAGITVVVLLGTAVLIASRTPPEPRSDKPARPGPALSVDGDVVKGDTRILTLRLTANREATEAAACLQSTQGILRAQGGPHPLTLAAAAPTPVSANNPADPCALIVTSLAGGAAGLPITVEMPASASLDVQIAERAYDDVGVAPWTAGQSAASTFTSRAGMPVSTHRFRWPPPSQSSH